MLSSEKRACWFVDGLCSAKNQSQTSPGGTVVGETPDPNTAAGAKEAGNAAYKAGRYDVAVALYTKAIELCDDESQRKVSTAQRKGGEGVKSEMKRRYWCGEFAGAGVQTNLPCLVRKNVIRILSLAHCACQFSYSNPKP